MACHVGMKLLRIQFPATCQELLQKTGLRSQTKNKKSETGLFGSSMAKNEGGLRGYAFIRVKTFCLKLISGHRSCWRVT